MSSIQRTKKLALVDCNSFYVSCERLFNPKIRRLPVVVLSNNDGCIISRSNEAKALGIKMGEPYFKARNIIIKNNVQVFSSNYSLYGDISRRVMRTLKRFNSKIEVYSIDEAFLDLSNFSDKEVKDVGKEIRNTVLQWTGIPTSIGIAETKTLSKVANHIAKKQKSGVVSLVNIKDLDPILEKVEVRDIWGVGKQLSKFYIRNGIYNEKQLKESGKNYIILRLGSVYGYSTDTARIDIMANFFSKVASQNGTLKLFAGGRQIKSLVPLIDVARCFKFMEERNDLKSDIFNLTKDTISVKEVAEICKKINPQITLKETNDEVPNMGFSLSNQKILRTGYQFLKNR